MPSKPGSQSGSLLTITDIDEVAVRIAVMWDTYNNNRRVALRINEEARQWVYATDIDNTAAQQLPHKNRTHQPKLTQIADTLKSEYFEASLSMPEFYRYRASKEDQDNAKRLEAWVRQKLEQRKFRETVGRQLISDFVDNGNVVASVDYIIERDDAGEITYKGPEVKRVSVFDIAINPSAESFRKSPKLQRILMHVAEISDLPNQFPEDGFMVDTIAKAISTRRDAFVEDWVEVLKQRGITMDGFNGFDEYFKQDMAELLVYRGDVFNPGTGELQRNRVVYVMDRVHVIRNEPSKAPVGFDGLHHAGWRVRPDNLWAQGPLDNLLGMQYRLDHLENLKADIFDQIAHPTLVIIGDNVIEPAEGWAPGAVYYAGADGDVKSLAPNATALNANTEIQLYHTMMDAFAGTPPDSRGVRTPGEKTAFEVERLEAGATKMFVDKARQFELLLEGILTEVKELMLQNFDGEDYIQIFNDITGKEELKQLSLEDVSARGQFVAIGARHWTQRNRRTLELQAFMQGPYQDPKVRMHVSGEKLTQLWERIMEFDDMDIIEPFSGVKEDVAAQLIAQAENQKMQGALDNEPGFSGQADPAAAEEQRPDQPEALLPTGGSPQDGGFTTER